ncbi:uncharacterized protein LOC119840542 isoform X2 [Zerene cesonia]|uniref:uncharacterized protein LOC119840542 isoform X2 n=1 Tax=Zerene cesonia TaxID=33412 RepID=UPI0018E57904|nr:uncharacterized protein LOC119840542 isoform X2 [Zerene cesonia]
MVVTVVLQNLDLLRGKSLIGKMLSWYKLFLTISLVTSCVLSAPVADNSDMKEDKSDIPVEQLEKLKIEINNENPDLKSEHIEYHRLDTVQTNGELVSRVEQHASADAVDNEKPRVHAETQLDVPSKGVHQTVVQDGFHVSVIEGTPSTSAPSDEQTTKVFHGAARLIQPGSATQQSNSQNGHTAVRRAFNADINKEMKNNMDHYASYSGVQYSPLDMAEYVFWTGDEHGVTNAIEEFLQEGLMNKEEAIAFLQEIKFNIDYLRAHYAQNINAAEQSAQQEKLRNALLEQNAKELQYRPMLQSFPFGGSPDIIRSISGKTWEMSNNLGVVPALPVSTDLRPEIAKRAYDPMMQTNVISTSDYDRDGSIVSEEEYEEMMEKLRAADTLYTEYSLEEIIYQLAKMMFSQSLSRDPASARTSMQRFMTFLELEAERGQLSRNIEKKVLDIMVAALTDTLGDHPELLQQREAFGSNSANRIMKQFLDASASEPGMNRAILSAYKHDLLKRPPLQKLAFEQN